MCEFWCLARWNQCLEKQIQVQLQSKFIVSRIFCCCFLMPCQCSGCWLIVYFPYYYVTCCLVLVWILFKIMIVIFCSFHLPVHAIYIMTLFTWSSFIRTTVLKSENSSLQVSLVCTWIPVPQIIVMIFLYCHWHLRYVNRCLKQHPLCWNFLLEFSLRIMNLRIITYFAYSF